MAELGGRLFPRWVLQKVDSPPPTGGAQTFGNLRRIQPDLVSVEKTDIIVRGLGDEEPCVNIWIGQPQTKTDPEFRGDFTRSCKRSMALGLKRECCRSNPRDTPMRIVYTISITRMAKIALP